MGREIEKLYFIDVLCRPTGSWMSSCLVRVCVYIGPIASDEISLIVTPVRHKTCGQRATTWGPTTGVQFVHCLPVHFKLVLTVGLCVSSQNVQMVYIYLYLS